MKTWMMIMAAAMCGTMLQAAPTAVSSSNESAALSADKAIDGNLRTRWASATKDDQTLTVDFGKEIEVKEIGINWEFARGKDYSIQLQDAKGEWKTVKEVKDNAKAGIVVEKIEPMKAKGMKLLLQKRGTRYGFSIIEIMVNGKPLQETK